MQNSRILFLLILLAALPALGLSSTRAVKPEISEHLLNQAWKAVWVSAPDRDRTSYGVFHFRRRFELEGKPGKFIVHISADNRYKLFVNGHEAGDGPARGDLEHWRFESYDLADRLRPGSNVIAAVVWNFDEHAPYAQMSHSTAFLVQGNSEAEEVVNTGEHWKVFENKAYSPVRITRDRIPSFHVTGPGDRVDGNSYPWGWEKPAFDDSAWEQAEPITKSRAWPRGVRDGGGYWCLVPRMIPQMEKKIEGPFIVRRGPDQFKAFLNKPWDEEPLTVPPGSKISLLLDKTHLTLAYPEFTVSGGAGSMISVTYAEAMFDDQRQKHHRDKVEGMNIIGNYDEFLPDGEAERLFTTLWVRTYRYIQLDIETADQALTIHPPASRFAAYPFEQAAVFKSDDPSLEKIWEVGWRTARLCAGETYFDCPYYEQLNYIGDTRIQALISLYVTGDDRLMRKAIMQFDDSRIPDGLTQSRYPTRIIQIIPPYSLFWIAMVYDHWMHCDDPEFVRSFLPGIRGVIEWFAGQVTENGLLGNLPWWNFVDWADEYRSGVPPGAVDGENAVISLQFVYVLQYAARLSEAFGRQCEADQYRALADRVGRAVMDRCWSEQRELIAETPEKKQFSQHANVMAILVDLVPREEQAALFEKTITGRDLIQCTFYYQFYLLEALKKVGRGNEYLGLLKPWHEMLEIGLTTFAEKPEPTRSDCHAWSASPLYGFLATVCGIEPAAPGFAKVKIAPHPGPLKKVEGAIPHPKGTIKCSLARKKGQGIRGEIVLPEGLTGFFLWQGQRVELHPGHQKIDLP